MRTLQDVVEWIMSKACNERRVTGKCSHPGCERAVQAAEVVLASQRLASGLSQNA